MSFARKTTSSATNKRGSRRIGTNSLTKIECRKGGLGLGPNILAYPLDISETGIRLVLKTEVVKGHEVEVVLQGGSVVQPLRRRAQVVWVVRLQDGTWCSGLLFQKCVPYKDVQTLGRILR
jgi:hypothetical protein